MSLLKKIKFFFLYLSDPPWDTNVSPPELIQFIQNHPPGSALDLGCGTGTNAIELARNGWRVIGVDFVGKAIRTAKKKARSSKVHVKFIQDDVSRLHNVRESFDLIVDIGCFHSINPSDRQKYIDNIDKHLANNGTYLLYAFSSNDPGSKTGIKENDVHSFLKFMVLEQRQDGTDRNRKSTWFTFRKFPSS